jgi:hypothetical protein
MASKFKEADVIELLVKCHRRCCICHRYCGTKIETDHIEPGANGGSNNIDNAILVCFECHAEIHCYNDRHPRGRKFRPEELRKHKEQWLAICSERPQVLIDALQDGDVGPLQALIDELEFNAVAATQFGCLFLDNEFHRAIREGLIATLKDELKVAILDAYAVIGAANRDLAVLTPMFNATLHQRIDAVKPKVKKAREELLQFLRSEQ